MNAIISATGLVKSFGPHRAVDGLDLEVSEGTVLGLLGPNGSGKSTTVSMLATLLRPDAGSASIAGADVIRRPQDVRRSIGLSGQYAAVDENLTGFENLDMIGRLYHLGRRRAAARADELLERMDLVEAGGRAVKTYSGGMRRRLDLAGAVVADVPIIFLDEPTTGLDPQSRNALWGLVQDLVDDGTTVLLTTQYLEEADQLADEIVVIDHGKVIAEGTPDDLKAVVGGERIEAVVAADGGVPDVVAVLDRVAIGPVRRDGRVLVAPVHNGTKALSDVLDGLEVAGADVREVGLRRPSLDDVFLSLTGRGSAVPASGPPVDERSDGSDRPHDRLDRFGTGARPRDEEPVR